MQTSLQNADLASLVYIDRNGTAYYSQDSSIFSVYVQMPLPMYTHVRAKTYLDVSLDYFLLFLF